MKFSAKIHNGLKWRNIELYSVLYTKQILIVSTFMELNGFMIGPEIKMLFKIKVVTVTARHPVELSQRKVYTNQSGLPVSN